MQVRIVFSSDMSLSLTVEPWMTIESIKHCIRDAWGFPPSLQTLVVAEKLVASDQATIASLELEENSQISVSLVPMQSSKYSTKESSDYLAKSYGKQSLKPDQVRGLGILYEWIVQRKASLTCPHDTSTFETDMRIFATLIDWVIRQSYSEGHAEGAKVLAALWNRLVTHWEEERASLVQLRDDHDVLVKSSQELEQKCVASEEKTNALEEALQNSEISMQLHKEEIAASALECRKLFDKIGMLEANLIVSKQKISGALALEQYLKLAAESGTSDAAEAQRSLEDFQEMSDSSSVTLEHLLNDVERNQDVILQVIDGMELIIGCLRDPNQ
jgi:hypothetical protein